MPKVTVRSMLASAGFTTASADVVDEVEEALGKRLPGPLRDLFLHASDEYLGGHSFMRVFAADEFADVLGQTGLTEQLPGYLYFASDDGDCFYATTPTGSVVKVERGAATREHVAGCAPDVETFVQRTLAGENWLGATSVQEGTPIASAIANQPAGTSTPPGFDAIHTAGVRCNVRIVSTELGDLYDKSNGFTAGGVMIRPIERVEPVDGITIPKTPGFAGALWFADDAKGARYAFVTSDRTKLRENDVVRVAPGSAFESGDRLGPLGDVVAGWLAPPDAKTSVAAKKKPAVKKRPVKTPRRSRSR